MKFCVLDAQCVALSDELFLVADPFGFVDGDSSYFAETEIHKKLIEDVNNIFYCLGNCYLIHQSQDRVTIYVSPLCSGPYFRCEKDTVNFSFDERDMGKSNKWAFKASFYHQITVRAPFECNWESNVKRVPPGFGVEIDTYGKLHFFMNPNFNNTGIIRFDDIISRVSMVVNAVNENYFDNTVLLFSGGCDSSLLHKVLLRKPDGLYFDYTGSNSVETLTCVKIAKKLGIDLKIAKKKTSLTEEVITGVYNDIFPAVAKYKWHYHWEDGEIRGKILFSGQNADSLIYYDSYNPGSLRGNPGRFIRNGLELFNRAAIWVLTIVNVDRSLGESIYARLGQDSKIEHVKMPFLKLLLILMVSTFLPKRKIFDEDIILYEGKKSLMAWFKMFKFIKISGNVNYNSMVMHARTTNRRFFPFSSGLVIAASMHYRQSWLNIIFPKWESYSKFDRDVYFGVIDDVDSKTGSIKKRPLKIESGNILQTLENYHESGGRLDMELADNFEIWKKK